MAKSQNDNGKGCQNRKMATEQKVKRQWQQDKTATAKMLIITPCPRHRVGVAYWRHALIILPAVSTGFLQGANYAGTSKGERDWFSVSRLLA